MIIAQGIPPPQNLPIIPLLILLLVIAAVFMRHRTRRLCPGAKRARIWLVISFLSVSVLGTFISVVVRATQSNRFTVDVIDICIGIVVATLVNFAAAGRWSNTFALLFVGPEKLRFGKRCVLRIHRFGATLMMTILVIVFFGGFNQSNIISLFFTLFLTVLVLVRLLTYAIHCKNCGMLVPFLCDWNGQGDE